MKVLLIAGILMLLGCQNLPKKASEYQLRDFRDVTLSNQLPVLLVPDKKLPYFQLILMVRSGSTSDPKNKQGLSYLTAHLLDKGTQKRSAEDLAESFEYRGSYFSVSVRKEFVELVASGLSFYKDELLKDFSEILLQPAFHRDEVQDMKDKALSHLIKTVDKPRHITDVALYSYLYEDHPYSQRVLGRKEDVKGLTSKDVFEFYRKHYTPQNSTLAVVGNFDNEKIISQLEAYLGKWTSSPLEPIVYPPLPEIKGVQILLVDRPEAKQTKVRLAHMGIKRTNPDFLTMRLANVILGYSFGSRLMDEIRVKRGLTYHISAGMSSRKDVGLFLIPTSTRHEKVGEIVQQTLRSLDTFLQEGPTRKELQTAKSVLKGMFPRTLETAGAFTRNLLGLRFYGVPETYMTHFYIHVDQVRRRDVHRVIKKYLSAENIKVVVYGPKSQIIEQLRPLGTVQTVSYKKFL